MNTIVLSYVYFMSIKKNLDKVGVRIQCYYKESDYFFDLRFYHEGVSYKTIVYKSMIPTLPDISENENVKPVNVPETIMYNNKDVKGFREEILYDFIPVMDFE